ncbi:MAG: NAD(P)-dependent alcohol dehydrogenase [Actinomycetota bacterium]
MSPTTSSTTQHDAGVGSAVAGRPTTMRAATHARYGDAVDVIELRDVDVPQPTADEVLIEVAASSLNAIDHHYVTGTPYPLRLMSGFRTPQRSIVGADVAGTVVATGSDVTGFSVGDDVVALVNGGGCARFVATTTAGMTLRPTTVSIDDAASTPVAGLTAIQGLLKHAGLRAGERVLVNGAAGGVGTFAVQIAAAAGAHVTAVCSGRNVEMVRALGADHVIDYTQADVADEVERTGERFDVVFDNVGNRPARTLARMLTGSGRVVLTTGPKSSRLLGPIRHMLTTRLSFLFRSAAFTSFVAEASADDLERLIQMIDSGAIRPAIDRVVGIDGVADGLAEIATGHTRAKIVVHPTESSGEAAGSGVADGG